MNKNIFAILEPGNPLMTQALDAMKRYYEAQQAKLPDEDVERMAGSRGAVQDGKRISAADAWAPLRHVALAPMPPSRGLL
ncbi:hypothetical protein ACF8FB_26070 [Pseudomonas sp. yb_2]|uniref:hypothetical protein n=1 Tax=Pseudomonas sp. yb_2 TaxID=3367218 RepID=UPI00370BC32A